jgi:hypothetical protein
MQRMCRSRSISDQGRDCSRRLARQSERNSATHVSTAPTVIDDHSGLPPPAPLPKQEGSLFMTARGGTRETGYGVQETGFSHSPCSAGTAGTRSPRAHFPRMKIKFLTVIDLACFRSRRVGQPNSLPASLTPTMRGRRTAPTVIDVNDGCCSAQTPSAAAGVSG